jgi:hypothetical protein
MLSYCKSLSSISFEPDSELTRIETEAFVGTHLDLIVVPPTASFIAGDAFPSDCAVTLAGPILMQNLVNGICAVCPARAMDLRENLEKAEN